MLAQKTHDQYLMLFVKYKKGRAFGVSARHEKRPNGESATKVRHFIELIKLKLPTKLDGIGVDELQIRKSFWNNEKFELQAEDEHIDLDTSIDYLYEQQRLTGMGTLKKPYILVCTRIGMLDHMFLTAVHGYQRGVSMLASYTRNIVYSPESHHQNTATAIPSDQARIFFWQCRIKTPSSR